MPKKRILLWGLIFIILALILVYFAFNSEKTEKRNLRKEFSIPNNTFIDVAYAVVLLHEDDETKNTIKTIDSIKELDKYKKNLRKHIIELLHIPLPEQEKINVSIIETIDKGKYYQNKLKIQSSEITRIPAYLLVPKNVMTPMPAIIAMHQHGNNYENGKEEIVGNKGDPTMFYGKELAERGYIVFAADTMLFGEKYDSTDENSPKVIEELTAQALFSLGVPPLGIVVQEDLIGLDFLYELDIVDKNNIGCIGHSFGGTRCNYLAALDDRIKVVAISNSVAFLISERIVSRTWLAILPGLGEYTGKRGLLALIAPKPQIFLYSENDPVFPADEASDIFKDLNNLYERLGYKENLEVIYLKNETHTFPMEYHEIVYRFFDKHLSD